MLRALIVTLFTLLMVTKVPLKAECCGKVDLGATLLHVDILESGKTVKTLHMNGLKGDANLVFWKGISLKPSFLIGQGNGGLSSFSIGIGQCLPVTDELLLIPSVGVTFSYLHTKIDIEAIQVFGVKERFRSTSPFVALEFCYKLTDKWTVMGMAQYAWCRTHTKIDHIISDKSKSQGPNYSLGVDYSLNKNWSINCGVGYNISLSKEKHGIRGAGLKLGLAYYF